VPGDLKVLHNIAFWEYRVALTAQDDPQLHPFRGIKGGDFLSLVKDFTKDCNSFSSASLLFDPHINDQAGQRIHQGSLPSAVGAYHTPEFLFRKVYAEVIEGQSVLKKYH
jgi:hypothetical protein